ncbi:MAG: hypothetical protein IPO15_08715 [Anaerolineae bacterium]|uniref:hypothetical protein n=1 Tax=Candidatus Amarolinea dominans TaxID=3140696 RepID=UPI0031364D8B|nr:hypothetical protein [Anaerolineae bacterium]
MTFDHRAAPWSRRTRRGLRQCQALLLLDELDVGPRIGLTYNDLARLRTVCQENRHFKLVAVSHQPLKALPDPAMAPPTISCTLDPAGLATTRRGLLAHPPSPLSSMGRPAT